jgi:hypothetical protein
MIRHSFATIRPSGDGLIGARPLPSGIPPVVSSSGPSFTNHDSDSVLNVETRIDHNARRSCMLKMYFPCFDGSDARVWLDQCESYFTLYIIPDSFRITAASLHLSGKVMHWYQSYKEVVGQLDWDMFKKAVVEDMFIEEWFNIQTESTICGAQDCTPN